ncbi:MAG: hypothetical protein V1709_09505 [Planctomycetota bacterium]
MNRPTALLVVAWLWIIIGTLITALYGGVVFTTMKEALWESCLILSVVVLVGIFSAIAGFYLIKLHNWARLSLEILSWLGLIYYLIRAKDFITVFWGIQGLNAIILLSVAIMIFGLIYVAPLIVSIILIRRKTVREAVKRRDTPTTPSYGCLE